MAVPALLLLLLAPGARPACAESGPQGEPQRGARSVFLDGDQSAVRPPSGTDKPEKPKPKPAEGPSPTAPESPAPETEMPPAHDGIRHWIELLPAEGIAPAVSQRVTERRVFRSGERIRLHFETNVAGHITLMAGGSSGRRQKLFPLAAAGLGDDRLEAYTPRILPAENAWIRFDDQPGEERIEVYFEPDRPSQEGIPRPPEAAGGGPLRLAAADAAAVTSAIERSRGSKDVLIEVDDSGSAHTGTYRVRRATGEAIAYEIVLRHE